MSGGSSVTYPLEGDRYEEARFYIYDGVGKTIWGQVRVRREKNPDVLVLEVAQRRGTTNTTNWLPLLMLTGVGDQLAVRTTNIRTPDAPTPTEE